MHTKAENFFFTVGILFAVVSIIVFDAIALGFMDGMTNSTRYFFLSLMFVVWGITAQENRVRQDEPRRDFFMYMMNMGRNVIITYTICSPMFGLLYFFGPLAMILYIIGTLVFYYAKKYSSSGSINADGKSAAVFFFIIVSVLALIWINWC